MKCVRFFFVVGFFGFSWGRRKRENNGKTIRERVCGIGRKRGKGREVREERERVKERSGERERKREWGRLR